MEMNLDLSLAFVPKTVSLFLGDVSRQSRDMSEKLAMLEDYVQRLEEEMKKVEAFKRELPLCMLLVNEAIARLREERLQCLQGKQDPPPVTEESTEELGKDKKNWMSSVQLWSAEAKSKNVEDDRSVPVNPIQQLDPKKSGVGGVFLTLSGASQVPSFKITSVSGLSHSNSKSGCGGGSSSEQSQLGPQPQPPQHMLKQNQNSRKLRRCWSPELHNRFIDALRQLGGAQVATPKQIRELMQVEGLTNDEVKSHLQKYRLHVRKSPRSSVDEASNGLWMTEDQPGDKSNGNLSQSGSPQGPLTPLLLGGGSGRNSVDAEDEQSDGWNWRSTGVQQQPEADNHSL